MANETMIEQLTKATNTGELFWREKRENSGVLVYTTRVTIGGQTLNVAVAGASFFPGTPWVYFEQTTGDRLHGKKTYSDTDPEFNSVTQLVQSITGSLTRRVNEGTTSKER